MAEVKNVNLYKAVTGWMQDDAPPVQEPETGLETVSVIIGDAEFDDGSRTYVVEPMYIDVLNDIVQSSKAYTIRTDARQQPQMFILQGGALVYHNYPIRLFAETIQQSLQNYDKILLCKALEDTLQQRTPDNQLFALMDVRSRLSRELQINVPTMFLKAVIRDFFINLYTSQDKSGMTAYLSALPFEDIIHCCNALNIGLQTGSLADNMVMDILRIFDASPRTLLAAIKDDLYLRVITGRCKS